MYQTDVTAAQYKIKKPEEIAAEKKQAEQFSVISKPQCQ